MNLFLKIPMKRLLKFCDGLLLNEDAYNYCEAKQ